MTADNTTARWRRIRALFQEALTHPADQQRAFLEAASDGDDALVSEVRRLLDAAQRTGQPLEHIIARAASEVEQVQPTSQFIQQYRILRLLGEGGMGQVYLAERNDEQYQQRVAIKVLGVQRPTTELVQRFRAERQILATLDHPNIARLLDGGETDDGAPFLVLEYIDGQSVDSYCDDQRLDTRARLRMFTKICVAVDHAHRNLIIHRDIKPSNILVKANGEPKLLDFGIAKLLESSGDDFQTRSSARLMSPLHASPEQIRGEPVSVASDIYSLGVLLYQLLTGQHPYEVTKGDATNVQQMICETQPLKPSVRVSQPSGNDDTVSARIADARATNTGSLARTLSGDLDNIVLMAMNKEPARRYASVREFIGDIERFLDHRPVSARPASLMYRTRMFLRRHRLPVAVAASAIVTVIGAVVVSVDRIADERDLARAERQKAEAVSEFLQSVFNGASPDVALGEDVTARQLLEYGATQVDETLEDQPSLRAAMQLALGEAFYSLSNLDRAEALYLDAKATLESSSGPALDELAAVNIRLATIYQDRSNYDDAERMYEDALAFRRERYGSESAEVVDVLLLRAHLTEFQGHLQLAKSRFEEALAMSQSLNDGANAQAAELQSKLAAVNRQLGSNDEAEQLLESAMSMQARLYSEKHPDYLEAQRYLADLYREQERFEEAGALYRENIAVRTEVLGPDHLEVGITYNEYSILLSKMGDAKSAVDAAEEFVRILDLNYDAPTSEYGAAYNNLAWMQHTEGDYDSAIQSFRKSMEVQDAIGLAPDHLHRSFPIFGIASTELSRDNYSEAEQLFRRALPMRRQYFDESHVFVSQVKSGLGGSLTGLGRYEEAKVLLDDALEKLLAHQGEDHKETVLARERLARLKANQP
ncbi:MAG: serine/threonine-protein kinase [Pseudomonadota bacterium]